jgi:hypothetical protein
VVAGVVVAVVLSVWYHAVVDENDDVVDEGGEQA